MAEYLNFKKSNCKNCYKCIRYCPVKSIRFSNNQANIITEDCILCGQCYLICPQNAKQIRTDAGRLRELLTSGSPVYASVAPSFVAKFDNVNISSVEKNLKRLGFAGAEETAVGATIVKREYEKMLEADEQKVIITTCCHTVNLLVQKYYPEAIKYLAPVKSPMQAHCMDIKRRYPGAKTVFIGPCLSKKAEGELVGSSVDCVLTFDELKTMMAAENLVFENIEEETDKGRARIFPTTGGILKSMDIPDTGYTCMAIDGIDNCMSALEDIVNGKAGKCFVEMSSCVGSCIGGPAMERTNRMPITDYARVAAYTKYGEMEATKYESGMLQKEFSSLAKRKVLIPDAAIEDVLRQMGKTSTEDELNCGSCGYNTCRDKARAVLDGKATISMCLPYLKEKAESFSDKIIGNTPNAIVVLNEKYEVQQVNASACRLLKLSSPSDIHGDQVVRVLDPVPFINVHESGKNIYNKMTYLAEYQKYVEQTIIYDKNFHIFICIMRDVTESAKRREEKELIRQSTIEITDSVIMKQMHAVQEIASLLGEATAETKVALTKLKESLNEE